MNGAELADGLYWFQGRAAWEVIEVIGGNCYRLQLAEDAAGVVEPFEIGTASVVGPLREPK